ncbi:MAG: DegV family protein [Lachnospiraceae bacterium]|nr:DegV family protein [Lachnospiraceae bacterium]
MSNDYVISACSTADLTKEHFENRNIRYIFFHYELNGKQYPDDLGQTMSFKSFYDAMRNGADTKTSQISIGEFIEYFEPMLQEGKDILHVSLSSGISGVVNSARLAQEELADKYPDRKLIIIDSMAASSGYGLLMDKLADLRDEGMGIEELAAWTEEHKLELNHWFFTSDLTYLIRGGRVSKTSGFFGGLLNICPLMNVDLLGRLIPRAKIRGKSKVIQAMYQKMEELAKDGKNYSGKCYMSNSDCIDDAKAISDLIEENFPNLNGKVQHYTIGTTIGSHTGPGTVALFFWGEKRKD